MSRVLVTGATGFLGDKLVELLAERGYEVVALARSAPTRTARARVTVRLGDVLDAASIRDAAAGCEGVFHCAGKVSRKPEDAEELYRVHVEGTKITLDAYAASHRTVADLKDSGELPKRVQVRSSKYLNNTIEQDHRRVKQRLRPMLGLKSFRTAVVVISGIELAEKIKKGQLKIGKLGGRVATMPEIWQAALAA